MSMPHIDTAGDAALQALRVLLARLDPESELLVDQDTGEILVRGNIDPVQLDAAVRQSGLGMRVADSAGGCCGGCGCG